MVGTGNPLFFNFFFFYRFTNGILLRTKRKIKSESEQGNASQLASILLCFFTHFYLHPNHCYQAQPPHTRQHPPSCNGLDVPWQVTVPGPPNPPQFLTILWDQPAPPATPGQPQLGTALLSSFPRAACKLGCSFLHAGGTEEAAGEQWE